jgi:uncharacterized protein DUF6084/CobW/HypB/UreG family nucleotide-binding protein
MHDLNFQVTGVEPAARGLTPLLHFNLEITNRPEAEPIQTIIIQAQIQIQAPQRAYNDREKERLTDLFGTPDRWGQTLRNRLWTHTSTTTRPFSGTVQTVLPVQCTYDFNVIATKYFYALEAGEVPLLFLFIENIGNLICPAEFPLGSKARVVVVSVTEGPYMVRKHPHMFLGAQLVVINKADLAKAMDVSVAELTKDVHKLKPDIQVIPTSCKSGEGLDEVTAALVAV